MTIKRTLILFFTFTLFFFLPIDGKTSMTDASTYSDFCQKAAKNPDLFKKFKTYPVYFGIVENVSKKFGRNYLDIILEQSPELMQYLAAFKQNDLYGNPKTYFYPETGNISPTTLRYIKVASDLKKEFGSLDNCTIVEVGGGYGGQCKILSDLFHIKEYIIIDLPGPLALAKKYLEKLQVPNVTFIKHTDAIPAKAFDLAISNYAVSECTTAMQRKYLERVFASSKNGYVIYNQIAPKTSIYPTKSQVLSMFSEFQIPWEEHPEKPLTANGNYLLTWN